MNTIYKRLPVIFGMIFVAWILILVIATDFLFYGFYGWAGFWGGIAAFGLSAVSLLLWRPDTGRDTTEINAIPLIFTSVYFVAMLLANTVFCFLAYMNSPRVIPVAVNLALTASFVSVRIFAAPYRDRVSHTVARAAEKTRGVVGLSAKLGDIMGMAQDEAVQQQLGKLKEQLDYSTNVSQPLTADFENSFFHQLCEIANALDQNMPTQEVLSRIDTAQMTWKRRNGASSAN